MCLFSSNTSLGFIEAPSEPHVSSQKKLHVWIQKSLKVSEEYWSQFNFPFKKSLGSAEVTKSQICSSSILFIIIVCDKAYSAVM